MQRPNQALFYHYFRTILRILAVLFVTASPFATAGLFGPEWWEKYSILPEVKTRIPDRLDEFPVIARVPEKYRYTPIPPHFKPPTPPYPDGKWRWFAPKFWMDDTRLLGTIEVGIAQHSTVSYVATWDTRSGEIREYGPGSPTCYNLANETVVIHSDPRAQITGNQTSADATKDIGLPQKNAPEQFVLVGSLGGPYEEREPFPKDKYTCEEIPRIEPAKPDPVTGKYKPRKLPIRYDLRKEDGWLLGMSDLDIYGKRLAVYDMREGEGGYIKYIRPDGTEALRYAYAKVEGELPPYEKTSRYQELPLERVEFFALDRAIYLPWSGKYLLKNALYLENQMKRQEPRSMHILDPRQGKIERYAVPPEIWRWARAIPIGGYPFKDGVLWSAIPKVDNRSDPAGIYLQRPGGEIVRISKQIPKLISPNGCRLMTDVGVMELCKGTKP